MINFNFVILIVSQALILVVSVLWIIGGKKMAMKTKQIRKAKKAIPSEINDDDYFQASEQEGNSSPPPAPNNQAADPVAVPVSEEEQIFKDWISDWFSRFSLLANASTVANTTSAELKSQDLLLLVGLAHNSDVLIAEQKQTNILLQELIKSQE